MIAPVMLLLSWALTFALGFLTAIWALRGRIAPSPQAPRASSSSGGERDPEVMTKMMMNGSWVFHLPETDRAAHQSRRCRALEGVLYVERRLAARRRCEVCFAKKHE
eukprot:7302503-Pyramimonas_sp.AAC.1